MLLLYFENCDLSSCQLWDVTDVAMHRKLTKMSKRWRKLSCRWCNTDTKYEMNSPQAASKATGNSSDNHSVRPELWLNGGRLNHKMNKTPPPPPTLSEKLIMTIWAVVFLRGRVLVSFKDMSRLASSFFFFLLSFFTSVCKSCLTLSYNLTAYVRNGDGGGGRMGVL